MSVLFRRKVGKTVNTLFSGIYIFLGLVPSEFLTRCLTVDQSVALPGPQFLHLSNGMHLGPGQQIPFSSTRLWQALPFVAPYQGWAGFDLLPTKGP